MWEGVGLGTVTEVEELLQEEEEGEGELGKIVVVKEWYCLVPAYTSSSTSFPGCFPESHPWELNLGAVLICSRSVCG